MSVQSVSDDFECMTDFEEGENPAVTPKTNLGSIVLFHYTWLAVQLSAVGSSATEEAQCFGSCHSCTERGRKRNIGFTANTLNFPIPLKER